MSFIETNFGKDAKVLIKAHYDRILLVPFIVSGSLIVLAGYLVKKIGPGLLAGLISDPEFPASRLQGLGDMIFFIFLIFGIVVTWIRIVRTTGIELAATESVLIGRYGKDAMCVPLEKIENFAIFKDLLGRIFKYGTVIIGTPSITMQFPFISEPEVFRDKVIELREECIRNSANR